eukprot:3004602-Prymnesium_polylepis.2
MVGRAFSGARPAALERIPRSVSAETHESCTCSRRHSHSHTGVYNLRLWRGCGSDGCSRWRKDLALECG